jgi:hypothetical protein
MHRKRSEKRNEALAILVSSCSSKFVGRRNVRGGYTYYDDRQNSTFTITGPNPTSEEWALIEKQYQKYLADVAAAEETRRRQEAERQRLQDEAQQQAALAQAEEARKQQQALAEQARQEQLAQAGIERRRQDALSLIAVRSVHIKCDCDLCTICPGFMLNTEITNQSSEIISMLSVGWAFITDGQNCPTSVQTKQNEEVRLGSGDTLVLNIEGHDGPPSKDFLVCVKINDAQIEP